MRATGIDPSRHPRGGPHQVLLGLVARQDGPDVAGPPREVGLDERVDARMLQHHVLEAVG